MRRSYVDAVDKLTERFVFSKGHALGAEFLVGFETEFILLKTIIPIKAVNDAPWSASSAVPSGSDAAKCLEEIADALRTGEIELLMYHSEAAPGQVRDFPVRHDWSVADIDAVVFTRETIVNIAAKYGLRATFTPRVYTDTCKYVSRLPDPIAELFDHRWNCSAYPHIYPSHGPPSRKPTPSKSKYQ